MLPRNALNNAMYECNVDRPVDLSAPAYYSMQGPEKHGAWYC